MHRPTWAACSENRVSKLSKSGSTWSFNDTWKMPIITFVTTTIPEPCPVPRMSCNLGYPQPPIPRRLHPSCRRACGLVCRAVLQGNVSEAYHHGPTNRSKDWDESVGAWEVVLRSSIGQEVNASHEYPVKWLAARVAEEGIQVSKDFFTEAALLKRSFETPKRFRRCAGDTRSLHCRTGSDRS